MLFILYIYNLYKIIDNYLIIKNENVLSHVDFIIILLNIFLLADNDNMEPIIFLTLFYMFFIIIGLIHKSKFLYYQYNIYVHYYHLFYIINNINIKNN